MAMIMNKGNTLKYPRNHMFCDTNCWIKLLKCFKRTFIVKNTCGRTINNVHGSKDNFSPISFWDIILEKKNYGGG